MAYRWSIEPEDYASISQNGLVTFDGNYSGTYTATCRDENDRCGRFIITRDGPGCKQPPQPTMPHITLEISETSLGTYGFLASDLKYGTSRQHGYKVHEKTSDPGGLEIIPTNVCIIAKALGAKEEDLQQCNDYGKDTCGYYDSYGVRWNLQTPGINEIFKRAWDCTAENDNWKATTGITDCNGVTYPYQVKITIKNNSTTYYAPYDGHFKMSVKGKNAYVYYRFCSDVDSTYASQELYYAHFHYGRTEDENQCSNYLLAPKQSITLDCVSDTSFKGITKSDITSPEINLSNLENKLDKNQNLPLPNHSKFHLSRGGLASTVISVN